jgi:hypothetical protein
MTELLRDLEASGLAEAVRTSAWIYPAASAAHVLAVVVLVGAGVTLDIRLIGWTDTPLRPLLRWLTPTQVVAAIAAAFTGLLLFAAEASQLSTNPAFQLKFLLLGLLLGNALGFTTAVRPYLDRWQHATRPPAVARACGAVAIAGWAATVIAARLAAFT